LPREVFIVFHDFPAEHWRRKLICRIFQGIKLRDGIEQPAKAA
jgi:hypothetical protein